MIAVVLYYQVWSLTNVALAFLVGTLPVLLC